MDAITASIFHGSSPRPWGTHHLGLGRVALERFIPTPVGNTGRRPPAGRATPVHPHARGEHALSAAQSLRASGSSPRPWGTRRLRRRSSPLPTVHPHARGEHPVWPGGRRGRRGSSPRPWGTRPTRGLVRPQRRFIPTPVGNTTQRPKTHRRHPVHPHARGEHISAITSTASSCGSSPRPWGTPSRSPGPRPRQRFIPTPVGNTPQESQQEQPPTVHPHARGEHVFLCGMIGDQPGSSPRPWGTQTGALVRRPRFRFIPTPVGNTAPWW